MRDQEPTNYTTIPVINDVDLYDVPGGNGNKIGMLRKGQVVPFGGCKITSDQFNHSCEINGLAWVWGQGFRKGQ